MRVRVRPPNAPPDPDSVAPPPDPDSVAPPPDPDSVAPPPLTRVEPVTDNYFGTNVTDPYRWLEDQQSPRTRAWIDTQNRYTDTLLSRLPGRDYLRARFAALLQVDMPGVPLERGGRYFSLNRRAGDDQARLCMRAGIEGAEQVLVDPQALSPDHTVSVTIEAISDDGRRLVYGLRSGGADEVTLHLFDVDARRDLADTLPAATYFGVDFTADDAELLYSLHTDAGPRIRRHILGTAAAADTTVFGERLGPEKIAATHLSDDGRYLLIHVYYGSAGDRVDVYYQDQTLGGPVLPLVDDVPARFEAQAADGRFYILTNWNAPRQRILAVAAAHAADRSRWQPVVPESATPIDAFTLLSGRLCVSYVHNATTELRVFEPDGRAVCQLALPALGTAGLPAGRWQSNESFLVFQSFFIPPTIYRCNVATAALAPWARQQVPVDSGAFAVEQVWYVSADGTRVPMFVAHRRDLRLDGRAPALLTAYGGFNLNQQPTFNRFAVVWMEQGGVFALPNIRGGGEFGEDWHRAGMLAHKQNVFDDFTAAARWLIARGYTSSARLAIMGGSNGGLLVGAALTQHPDLFRAVLCEFPLLDMLRYQNFLVAPYWVPEYGSSQDAAHFPVLRAYSPYHNVRTGERYPGVLFVTGDADTRVAPLHARKMAALLQAAAAPGRPVLLKYDVRAGHSGGKPVAQQVADAADELGFLLWQVGVTPAPPDADD